MKSKLIISARQIRLILFISLFSAAGMHSAAASGETRPNERGPVPGIYVNTYTGNLFYERHDLFIPGRGISLDISFYYNSGRKGINLGMGNGWTSSFSMNYSFKGDNIIIDNPDGRMDEYVKAGDFYETPQGLHARLEEYEPGKFRITGHHGDMYYFDDPSHRGITKMADRNANLILYQYSGGMLSQITDASGRTINFLWNNGKLAGITDTNTTPGRTLSFSHDTMGNLMAITNPLGQSTNYQYYDEGLMSSVNNPANVVEIVYNENSAVSEISCSGTDARVEFIYEIETAKTLVSRRQLDNNSETAYLFDQDGRVIRIDDHLGNPVYYNWDDDNNLIGFTNRNGHTLIQNFDDHGNLIRQTDFTGNERLYSYETTYNLVTSRTDEKGNLSSFYYDSRGNLIRSVDAAGKEEIFTYDDKGNRTSFTDKNGTSRAFSFDIYGNITQITDPLGHITVFTFDMAGNKISETDANGNSRHYEYDLLNRLISSTDPAGNAITYTWDPSGNLIAESDANGNTTAYSYDPLNRLVEITDPAGNQTQYSYDPAGNRVSMTDANGNTISFSYNLLDQLTEVTDASGNQINYSYDPVGNLISETDTRGNTSTYTYDAMSRLVSKTDPLGNTVRYSYDPVGNKISVKDVNGGNYFYIYDKLNRLIKTVDQMGFIRLYSYDGVGNLLYHTDPNENVTTYSYDPLNRLISKSTMAGSETTYSYDPIGNMISETDENGFSTNYSYDNLNRLASITDAMGYVSTYSYDPVGNLISETDANGNNTAYSYDPLNRLTELTDALGNVSSYSYDPLGNRISETDPNGNITSYSYDPSGHLNKAISPLGNQTSYEFDGEGNMIKRIDPKGQTTTYSYDALNRLISVAYPTGSIEKSYDAAGNLILSANFGIGLEDQNSRTYDALNRLIAETINYGAFTKTFSYTYDPAGNLLEVTGPDGMSIQRSFNNENDLVSVTDGFAGTTEISRDPGGNNTQTELAGGYSNSSSFDAHNNLLNRSIYDESGTAVFIHENTYDPAGNIINTAKNGLPQANFSYDALNRIKTANYPWAGKNMQYAYDPAGNRISKTVNTEITTLNYNAENRVVSQVFPDLISIIYAYDKNGNLAQTGSSWGVVNYKYDFENRLINIDYPGEYGYISLYYSPEGKLLARDERGNMKFFLPTLLGNLLEMDASGNPMVRINPSISQARDFPAGLGMEGTQVTYSHWGEESSTTAFTSNGIVTTFEFDYFGEILNSSGDIESVDPGLYASGNKVDWDPMLGAELIGTDYAPDIDQHYGNHEINPVEYFGPGSDPFDNLVYSIYRNERKQIDVNLDFGPGSDPFENHVYNTQWYDHIDYKLFIYGPEMVNIGEGVNGSNAASRNGPCGFNWNEFETEGSLWVYIGCFVDESYLPQKRMIWKFEKTKTQVEYNNTCLLVKGHTEHHAKSEKQRTGITRQEPYTPPFIKKIPSAPFTGDWPKKEDLDKAGKAKEKELNR